MVECMNEWMNERVNDVLWGSSFYETQASKRSKIKNVVVVLLVAISVSFEGLKKIIEFEGW